MIPDYEYECIRGMSFLYMSGEIPTFVRQKSDNLQSMSNHYTFSETSGIFGSGPVGWMSEMSISALFYRMFGRIPSLRKVGYLTGQEAIREIARIYKGEDGYDMFDCSYEDRLHDGTASTGAADDNDLHYDCVIVCREKLIVGYFNKSVTITFSGTAAQAELPVILDICERYRIHD